MYFCHSEEVKERIAPVILRRSKTDVRIYLPRIRRTPPTASKDCAAR